jgi:branched-chain amino acid transport system substrate-binding protein
MWKRGIRRASVIYIDNAYGSGLANRFQEVFKGIGGSVVQSVSYPSDKQKDFGNEVQTALQGLVDADALVILGYDSDSAAIGFALDSANTPKLSYWGCDGNFTSGFLANSPISLLRGIKGSGFRTTSGDRYETFVAQYQAATRSKVEAYSAHAYDAIYLMALALARSETNTKEGLAANLAQISSGTGTKVYPGEFAKAVELLKQGTAIDYSGVSGEVDFDGNGDVKIDSNDLEKFYYIWRVKDDLSGFEEDKN